MKKIVALANAAAKCRAAFAALLLASHGVWASDAATAVPAAEDAIPAIEASSVAPAPGASSTPVPEATSTPVPAASSIAPVPESSSAAPSAIATDEAAVAEGIEIRSITETTGAVKPAESAPPTRDLWERIRAGFAMPNLETKHVIDSQNWYTARPEQIRIMAERSRRYLFHIVEEIEKRGMPMELALLPMVESAFNPMAYSRAHASGLWQFIPSTGRTYNLAQNWWFDARRDVVEATTAALEYLQTIYEMHGHWHLALASYNWGENAVARAVERNRRLGLPTDYANLPMPNETRFYVPKLQALKNIILNPAAFGIELEPIPNEPHFATVTLTRDIDVKLAARLAEMPVEDLIALNPGHNRPVMSSARAGVLVLPADRLDRFLANVGSYDRPLSSWRAVGAQRGQSLEAIAKAHDISVDKLRRVNGIAGTGRLRHDAELLVPIAGARPELPTTLFQGPAMILAEGARPAAKAPSRRAAPVRVSAGVNTSKYKRATVPPVRAIKASQPTAAPRAAVKRF
jgi:membrane-bound lytic murein transglycosylase D